MRTVEEVVAVSGDWEWSFEDGSLWVAPGGLFLGMANTYFLNTWSLNGVRVSPFA